MLAIQVQLVFARETEDIEPWVVGSSPPSRTHASFIIYEGMRLQNSPPPPRLAFGVSLLWNFQNAQLEQDQLLPPSLVSQQK